jgi:EmrB/QacA subfamily drug resistance transporter
MEQTSTHKHHEYSIKVIMTVLLAGAFVAILNQTLLATALPHIMADLKIDATKAQWLTTVFMLVNGIMIPVTAFLIGKFSTRGLFLTAMGLFAIGTGVAAISPTFSLLLVGRVLQAAGAGIMLPLMQTILLLMFPIEKRGSAMGMVGLVIAFAPAIGPTLSGWIVDSYSWRYLFYLIFPIAVIDIIFAYFALKNVTERKNPTLDVLSIILSTLGFGGLLFGFSNAGSNGWGSLSVLAPLIVGIVTLVLFIVRQFKLKEPILEFRVFKNPIFTLTTIIAMIVFTAMIGGATILPLYIQGMLHYSALRSGLILLPGAILMGIMSPITGRIFDKVGARGLSLVGTALLTIGTLPFVILDDHTSITLITIMYAVRMLGMAMVMMPLTTAGLNQLPRELITHGTAMNNTMRQVAGAIGTAVLITVMSSATKNAETADQMMAQIHGVNMAFLVTAVLAFVALLMSIFVKGSRKSALSK